MSPEVQNFLTQMIALLSGLSAGVSLFVAFLYVKKAFRRGPQGSLARHITAVGTGYGMLSLVIVAAIRGSLPIEVTLIGYLTGLLLVLWALIMMLLIIRRRNRT